MIRFTDVICIELAQNEVDALLLILNETREKLPLPIDSDVYRELLRKLGLIQSEKCLQGCVSNNHNTASNKDCK